MPDETMPPRVEEEKDGSEGRAGRSNFIREIIDADLAGGKYEGFVVTRFPPEPNGYLHIGHAKSICLNFGIAKDYGGRCNMRFDDTNPLTEDTEFVEAIQADVRWLGFDWGERTLFASDYFEQMYEYAVKLIKEGKAYVDSLTRDEIAQYRGTLTEPGRESPYRSRSVAENLDLFARMRAGEFEDGSHVLRAKIDMASPNMLMRDPLLYRIRHASHHRTGDAWCIYPMYDFAHCLEDGFEGVSHSICTLEFETNRALYDWVLDQSEWERRPRQIEFARLDLSYTVLSKRYLSRMVEEGHVNGWDDPRMPTLAGLRRRGVTPEAIRAFCDMIGVSKANSTVDLAMLEYCLREDLNHRAPRVMCVLRPLKVVITNYPENHSEMIDASYWPHDIPKEGSRQVPFSRVLYIERDDFREDPLKDWFRLAPGREVRLRYAYVIKCLEVLRDETTGEVTELRCAYDPETRHGAQTGRKVKGTLHWVSAAHAIPAEVRLYDSLLVTERPGADPEIDFISQLNPSSLIRLETSLIEPSVRDDPPGTRYQFERQGYFYSDPADSKCDALVFNRIVSLRDSWAKIAASQNIASDTPFGFAQDRPDSQSETLSGEKLLEKRRGSGPTKAQEREAAREANPSLAQRFTHYTVELGLDAEDSDRLTGDPALAAFFEEATAAHDNASSVARWIVNELLREIKDTPIEDLPFTGAQFGALVALVDAKTLSNAAGKEVLAEMMKGGRDPAAIVQEKGLTQVSDAGFLERVIDEIISDHPDHVARYKAGKTQLLGFFMGQVMKATGGTANPQLTKELLEEKLG